MQLQLLTCTCLLILHASVIHQVIAENIEPSEVNGIEYGEMEDYWMNGRSSSIQFMQEDKLIPGNILMYSNEQGLISLSPDKEVSVVAGQGRLISAGVGSVTSFAQHNSTTLILVDGDYNCLLWLRRLNALTERPDFVISRLAGECRRSNSFISEDGDFDTARFNQPGYIIQGRNNTEYFISEAVNNDGVVKSLRFDTSLIQVFLGGVYGPEWRSPHAMVFVPARHTMYISTRSDMYFLKFVSAREDPMGNMTSGKRNVADGKLEDSQFVSSLSLTALYGDTLLALPSTGNRLRVIDLKEEFVYSIELPDDKRLLCVLAVPSQQRIYFGGSNGLSVMHYKNLNNGATSLVGTLSFTLTALMAYVLI